MDCILWVQVCASFCHTLSKITFVIKILPYPFIVKTKCAGRPKNAWETDQQLFTSRKTSDDYIYLQMEIWKCIQLTEWRTRYI